MFRIVITGFREPTQGAWTPNPVLKHLSKNFLPQPVPVKPVLTVLNPKNEEHPCSPLLRFGFMRRVALLTASDLRNKRIQYMLRN